MFLRLESDIRVLGIPLLARSSYHIVIVLEVDIAETKQTEAGLVLNCPYARKSESLEEKGLVLDLIIFLRLQTWHTLEMCMITNGSLQIILFGPLTAPRISISPLDCHESLIHVLWHS